MSIFTEIFRLCCRKFNHLCFLPQLIKTFKSKSAKDISLGMFISFALGFIWLTYGILIKTLPSLFLMALLYFCPYYFNF